MTRALITGLAGLELSDEERRFLSDACPAGIILFKRNIADAAQLRRLVDRARTAVGQDGVLVLIDQEGGRVQRIKSPLAHDLPPADAFARLYRLDKSLAVRSAFAVAQLAAAELAAFGITMNCAPVLDVPVDGAHDIIGDRAYGRETSQIIALGRAVANGLLAGGVVPVIKHIPGHGRATADSHLDLPVVTTAHGQLSRTDFVPFKALSDLPAAMTAHVVYSAIDPESPASTSLRVTRDVIRGEIGFDGFLMSDDLSMKALAGPMRARAAAVLSAGSDVALHCNGDMAEMEDAAAGAGELSGRSLDRFQVACRCAAPSESFDLAEAVKLLENVKTYAA